MAPRAPKPGPTAEELAIQAKHAERLKIREDQPGSWIAVDPADQIIGTVTDVDQAWSDVRDGGSWYPLLRVNVEEAVGYQAGVELTVHAFGAVLYNEIMKRRPVVGERIKIVYIGEGEAKTKGMNPPKIYRVSVIGREHEGAGIYDRITGDNPPDPRRNPRRQQPAGDVPADTSDFTQPVAAGTGGQDDDIPF